MQTMRSVLSWKYAPQIQNTSVNHGCIVALATLCRLRLSALANQARTAGRTSNLDKTGMFTRMCRWASIVLAFKLQRSSSLRMLYALTSLSTSHECGLAAKTRARASDIGSHASFDRLSFNMSCSVRTKTEMFDKDNARKWQSQTQRP